MRRFSEFMKSKNLTGSRNAVYTRIGAAIGKTPWAIGHHVKSNKSYVEVHLDGSATVYVKKFTIPFEAFE